MFEKNMRIAYLLDVYGEILDSHSKGIMKAYYEDDLSLSEIALDEKISRQGVRHIIKKAEEQLDFLESKLGLSEIFEKIRENTERLDALCSRLRDTENSAQAKEAYEILCSLRAIGEANG